MEKQKKDLQVIYEDHISGGAHWSMLVRRGITLRLIDIEGGANVGMLMYNPYEKLERYNAPDTLKCQHTFKLNSGHCLYSDMGRIFCSIINDSCGWHDTIGGNLNNQLMQQKWDTRTYQEYRNEWSISGEHAFLVELAKYGLNKRDLAANLNFFSKVITNEAGELKFIEGNSKANDFIDLRFEMDTLVVMHTCPHPMSTLSEYQKKPIGYQLLNSSTVLKNDECMNSCAENQRGFENNRLYHIACNRYETGV